MNKIVINHIEKVYVTSDCATIVQELQVEHPAANVVVQAAGMQEKEIGDGSNLVVMFVGELLKKAEELLGMGLHPSDIVTGYDKASKKALEYLSTLTVEANFDLKDVNDLAQACRTAISSKCFGHEDFLSLKVAEACLISMPENPLNFLVDNIRTVKILGSNVRSTEVVNGMVLHFRTKTNTKRVEKGQVLVLATNLGLREMDSTQNVLFENADDLMKFSRSEEEIIESSVKKMYDMGVRFLVLNNKASDLEYHYLNKYGIYTVIVISKFQRRRMCRMLGARMCVTKDYIAEDLGFVQLVEEIEIGGRRVSRIVQAPGESCVSTIVIRGASQNIMNDVERAIHDGVNTIRQCVGKAHSFQAQAQQRLSLVGSFRTLGPKCLDLTSTQPKPTGKPWRWCLGHWPLTAVWTFLIQLQNCTQLMLTARDRQLAWILRTRRLW